MELILTLIAIAIFAVYNGIIIWKFGIPRTLSESFYLLEGKKKWLGYVFTGMMFLVCLLLMPAWFGITETISPWSHYCLALPFFGAASIAFVGAAPAFRGSKMEGKVHTIAAGCAAFFSLAWCAVVCYHIWYLIPVAVAIIAAIAFLTKTERTKFGYWIEMVAFLATFSTIIVECIIKMLA